MKRTKHTILILIGIVMSGTLYSQGRLEVTIQNIKELKGSIRVGLFVNEKTFLKQAATGEIVSARAEEVTVVFENLKSGDYGISVIHDANENGEMDTNFMGFPKEGFAFGNNAMGMFGPPDFEKAKVTISDKLVKQVIKLKYL